MKIEINFKPASEYNYSESREVFSGRESFGFRFIVEKISVPAQFKKMFSSRDVDRAVFVSDDDGGLLHAGNFKATGDELQDRNEAKKIAHNFIEWEIKSCIEKRWQALSGPTA